MSLEKRIENEFKSAMKARDALKLSTLRMLKADMNNVKLEKNKAILSDEEITKVIHRQVKQHRDSIEQFEKGKREDLAEKEKKELQILLGYLPEQLSEEELKKIIAETIKELGARDKKEMGKVIKTVMEKARGRAEGKKVSRFVQDMFGSS